MKPVSVSSRIGLPLLAKELIEQAARKRTYVVRVLYAILLFAASFLFFYETLRIGRTSPFAMLGRGRNVFDVLIGLQFAGVYLFMPAITCGVLTQEKERNSLMLLFLTRLGPWTIVFEKLLGRLIPMGCFLLLSLPLLAFAYSLGGISTAYLWSGVWLLGAATLQMGTLALFCSAWFRTTVQAFVCSYLFSLLMFFGPQIFASLFFPNAYYNSALLQALAGLTPFETPEGLLWAFFAPRQFFVPVGTGANPFLKSVLCSVPILVSSATFVLLARFYVVRRAFVPPRHLLQTLFNRLDTSFVRFNENRLTRGVVLIREKSTLPEQEPVAWRETTKRSLGRAQYLLRIFLAIEIPLAFVVVLGAGDGSLAGAMLTLLFLWFIAVLLVSVQSASLIAGERTHQTLEVLSTTPLTGREILLQKFRGVRRLMLILLVPFFTIFLFETWWHASGNFTINMQGSSRPSGYQYFVCSALSVFIYLPLVAWLSFLIGLAVRTQTKAILGSLGAIVAWCVLPVVFIWFPAMILIRNSTLIRDGIGLLLFLSPATILFINESRAWWEITAFPWLAVGLNFVGYGSLLLILRQICLLNADRFLGRGEGNQ